MRHTRTAMLVAALTASVSLPSPAQTPSSPPPPNVKVGEAAPDFTLPYLVPKAEGGFETRQVALSSFRGKQNVELAFFPAAFSPG
jgi:hypothetical protein